MAATIDSRYIVVGDSQSKPTCIKQPNDIFIYTFDFAAWLDTDTLAAGPPPTSVTTAAGNIITPPTVANVPSMDTTTTRSIKVTAGGDGWAGKITIRASTTLGQTKEVDLFMTIKET